MSDEARYWVATHRGRLFSQETMESHPSNAASVIVYEDLHDAQRRRLEGLADDARWHHERTSFAGVFTEWGPMTDTARLEQWRDKERLERMSEEQHRATA